MNATELFSLVEQYHSLGIHRTGTAVDRETVDWFTCELEKRAATVSHDRYDFPFFEAHCEVLIDSASVQCVANYYSGTGRYKTSTPFTETVNTVLEEARLRGTLDGLAAQANHQAASTAVLASHCPTESLCAINERPRMDGAMPSVLVAGTYAQALNESRVDVVFDAHIETRQSTNVIARLGNQSGPPVVVTTPLTGWFGCAGERGTGIAVLLDIIEPLAEVAPLLIVGATGHELDFFGGWHYAAGYAQTPRAVLHLGSSIATAAQQPVDGSASLSEDIQVTTNLNSSGLRDVESVATGLGMHVVSPAYPLVPEQWVGESACWARFDCPMLSVAGYHNLFHTPEDVPSRATTPELLQAVSDAVLKMALTLLAST